MARQEPLHILFRKYIDGNATAIESLTFLSMVDQSAFQEELAVLIDQEMKKVHTEDRLSDFEKKQILKQIFQEPQIKKANSVLWPRIAVAIFILLIISVRAYFFSHRGNMSLPYTKNQIHDISPGSNKAILTLSDGKRLILNEAPNGNVAMQHHVAISKLTDGQVIYQSKKHLTEAKNELTYNTLTTPRGGQYHLILSDGTQVWLDAASSITFPVFFAGNRREVKITGQVYFEVATHPSQPFKVSIDDGVIEVLGTHFNISAYPDEETIKATLLEGSIKISTPTSKSVLTPGQQAQITGTKIRVIDANLEESIAWHKGLFQFQDADIQTVMRQIARWYDVEISYEMPVTNRRFSGKIHRDINALKVSEILSYKDIHFRIEGKKIIVMPEH